MQNVVIDFESFFSKDVNLRKLSTLEYIRHPQFRVFGAAVKFGDEPAQWLNHAELRDLAATTDWSACRVITHNSLFDLTVMHERYGVIPGERVDTIGLCRATLPRDLDFSLDKIGPLLGLKGKKGGGAALQAVKGVEDPTQEQLDALAEYAIVDAEICYGIYQQLIDEIDPFELQIMNLVLRMSTQGIFEVDDVALSAFEDARREVDEYRQRMLMEAGVTATQVRSRDKFAALLKERGVEPPTKISERTGKETWDLSKQNPDFVALRADSRVAELVEARLAWASNAAITRIDRLANIGKLPPYTLPVMLQYGGAKTGRFSGGGGINSQNLQARGRGAGLRKGFRVRDGYTILVLDLAGIELRMNMTLNGQWDAVETIRQGGDLYIQQAAAQFNKPEAKVAKEERQFGKILELGLGYGMGVKKFRNFVATGPLGMRPMYLSEQEAHDSVMGYRNLRSAIPAGWRWFNNVAIPHMYCKNVDPLHYGPLTFEYERMVLADKWTIHYTGLRPLEEGGWVWGINGVEHNIWGGIINENACQGLSALLLKEQMLMIDKELDGNTFTTQYQYPQFRNWDERIKQQVFDQLKGKAAVAHQVHDELLIACREKDVDDIRPIAERIMTTPPTWLPELPLEVEGGHAQEYSK